MGIFTLDSKGQVVEWSRSAEKIFGWSEEETLGAPPPQVPEDEVEELRRRVKCGFAADGHEVSRLRRDGSVVDLEAWSAPIRGADGDFTGMVVLIADVTDRKRLEREILEVSAREQSRIGQDLHDSLGQRLAGIAFLSKAVAQKLSAQSSPESSAAAEIAQLVTQAMTQARHLARGLYPVALEVGGLMAALDEMSANMKRLFGVSCVVEADDCLSPSDDPTTRHIYYVVQEAVTNAIKHGQANNVFVRLERTGDKCMLTVRDDGTGFVEKKETSKGMGLHIMRYRANMIHASFHIAAQLEGGTIVRLTWPWAE
jgi:PAS domain S-box-containing protein